MASILRFDNWQNSDGTSIATTDASGNISFAGAGAGKILQVVRATDTTKRTTTSGSFVDANISVTITPTSATSDILLIWSAFLDVYGTGSSNVIVMAITDSANNLISGAEGAQFGIVTADRPVGTQTVIAYDSPATTSATTYKGRFRVSSTTTGDLRNEANTGQLYAIEVGS